MNNDLDLTGLTPQQINKVRELVQEFRESSQSKDGELLSKLEASEDANLTNLHHQFNWLVADLDVKTPLTRSQIYDS